MFNGANSYISPNFYPSKKIDGKAVPTWNYSAVHVNGQITLHDNEQWCRDFLERFTSEHEGDADDSWRIDDAPKHYIDRMLKAIVGVEIVVDTMIGKYKLSQNQSLKNVSGVVKGLGQRAEEGDEAMAELVATYNAERIGE